MATPQIGMVIMENTGYELIAGQNYFQTTEGGKYEMCTAYSGIDFPSLPNYLALTSGSELGKSGTDKVTVIAANNIFHQLELAGFSWKCYAEGFGPADASRGGGGYASKHDPAANYASTNTSANHVGFGGTNGLMHDITNSSLPDFFFIAPNLLNDAHSSTIKYGDDWAAGLNPGNQTPAFPGLEALLAAMRSNGLLVFTYDTDHQANHVWTFIAGPPGSPTIGAADFTKTTNHYSFLAGVQDAFGVPRFTSTGTSLPLDSRYTAATLNPLPLTAGGGGGGSGAPNAPQITAPAQGSTTASTTVTVSWNASSGGAGGPFTYKIDRGDGAGFVTPSSGTTGLFDTHTYPVGAHTVQVVGIDHLGVQSAASSRTFTAPGAGGTAPSGGVPTILQAGHPVVGGSITADSGQWAGTFPFTFDFQFQHSADSGATWQNATGTGAHQTIPGQSTGNQQASYTVDQTDLGDLLRCRVTVTNSVGSSPVTPTQATLSVNAQPPPSNAAWRAGEDSGGGFVQVVATHPTVAGRAAAGGDTFGMHTTAVLGDLWVKRNGGRTSAADLDVRAMAWSRKTPTRCYIGVGVIQSNPTSSGYFGYIDLGSPLVTIVDASHGFATDPIGLPTAQPRPVGNLIQVDYDQATGVELVYFLSGLDLCRYDGTTVTVLHTFTSTPVNTTPQVYWGMSKQAISPSISAVETLQGRPFRASRLNINIDGASVGASDSDYDAGYIYVYRNSNAQILDASGTKIPVSWADIGAGLHDSDYLIPLATAIKNDPRFTAAWPFRFCFHHEIAVNTPNQKGWDPSGYPAGCGTAPEYVSAFRHVRDVFDAQHATTTTKTGQANGGNCIFVFCPTTQMFINPKPGASVADFEPNNGAPAGTRYYHLFAVDAYNPWLSTDLKFGQDAATMFDAVHNYAAARGVNFIVPELGIGDSTTTASHLAKAAWLNSFRALLKTYGTTGPGACEALMWTLDTTAGDNVDSSTEAQTAFVNMANDPFFSAGITAPPSGGGGGSGAWASLGFDSANGVLYPVTYGTPTSPSKVYRVTNPRGTVAVSAQLTQAPPIVEDMSYSAGVGIVAACGSSGVYKVSVDGQTWTPVLTNTGSHASSVDAQGQFIVAGFTGTTVAGRTVATSINGGANWAYVGTAGVSTNEWGSGKPWWLTTASFSEMFGAAGGFDVSMIRIDPASPSTIYAAGSAGVWSSRDAGRSWRPAVVGLNGTQSRAIISQSGSGPITVDASGYGQAVSSDYQQTVTRNPTVITPTPIGLSSGTYSIVRAGGVWDVRNNGVSIGDVLSRGALVDPRDIRAWGDGHVAIVQFTGGTIIYDPQGAAVVQPPTPGGVSIDDTTPIVGQTIHCIVDDPSWGGTKPLEYAYQWQTAPNATGPWQAATGVGSGTSAYTIPSADANRYLRCVVTGTNTAGTTQQPTPATSAVASGAVAPANTSAPTLAPLPPLVGSPVTGSSGTWTGAPAPTYTGVWEVASSSGGPWNPGAGATSQTTYPGDTYTPAAGDLGKFLRLTVTATNSAGSASATSAITSAIQPQPATAPQNTVLPSITLSNDPPIVGDTIIADQGTWIGTGPITYAYQWQASLNGGGVWAAGVGAGATSAAYTIPGEEATAILRVRITATNANGSSVSFSLPTPQVTNPSGTQYIATDSITVTVEQVTTNLVRAEDSITVTVTPSPGGDGGPVFGGGGTGPAYDFTVGTRMPAWMRLDNTELANPARTLDYMRFGQAGPGVMNIGPSPCGVLYRIDGQPEVFSAPNEDPAPWYDPLRPESGQFLGLIVNDLSIGSITRRSPVDIPGKYGGAAVGPRQSVGRHIDVRATLVASSCSGAEFGIEWLSGVLGEAGCDTCGSANLEFRNVCPPDDGSNDALGQWIAYQVALTAGPDVAAQDPLCNLTDVTWSWVSASPYLYKPPVQCIPQKPLDPTVYPGGCMGFDSWLCGPAPTPDCCTIAPPLAGTWSPIVTIDSPLGVGSVLIASYATCPPDLTADQPVSQMIVADLHGTLVIDSSQHLVTYISPDGSIVRDGTDHLYVPSGQPLQWTEVDACDLATCLCVSPLHPCASGEQTTVSVDAVYRRR